MSGARRARVVALAASAALAAGSARADEAAVAYARVVVDSADLRTGPGVSYRVLQSARRGEPLATDGRPGPGFWLRVTTADGRTAYLLGDEVQTYAVTEGTTRDAPARRGPFAPPPLEGARAGLALMAGALVVPVADGTRQAFGYMEARPALVLHPTVTLEGFVGATPTSDGSQVLYGGAVQINLAPTWALCPYVGLGGGGLSVLPNADSFVLRREHLFAARAGGGVLFALQNRILVRVEGTHTALFRGDVHKDAQTVIAGLGVYF